MLNSEMIFYVLFCFPLLAIVFQFVFVKNPQGKKVTNYLLPVLWLLLVILNLVMSNGYQTIAMGNWHAPFGIQLGIDPINLCFLFVIAFVVNCIFIYSWGLSENILENDYFYVGVWLVILGVQGIIFTEDLFNLYVWSEVILISSLFLLINASQLNTDEIYYYAVFNIVATMFMLFAIGLLYGVIGSLYFADIQVYLNKYPNGTTVSMLGLFIITLFVKSAVFPFNFWLPVAYPSTSGLALTLLSAVGTKSILYVLCKIMFLWLGMEYSVFKAVIIVLATLTMLSGVMAAANESNMKTILSFHIISQIGYILLAMSLQGVMAFIATIFFLVHNIFVKTNLLMISDIIESTTRTNDIYQLGEIAKSNRFIGFSFLLMILSLAGFPPFSGFWAKFLVLVAAYQNAQYLAGAIAIFVSLFTLYSMFKMWRFAFCEESKNRQKISLTAFQIIPVSLLCFGSIILGVYPDLQLSILKKHADRYMVNQSPELKS